MGFKFVTLHNYKWNTGVQGQEYGRGRGRGHGQHRLSTSTRGDGRGQGWAEAVVCKVRYKLLDHPAPLKVKSFLCSFLILGNQIQITQMSDQGMRLQLRMPMRLSHPMWLKKSGAGPTLPSSSHTVQRQLCIILTQESYCTMMLTGKKAVMGAMIISPGRNMHRKNYMSPNGIGVWIFKSQRHDHMMRPRHSMINTWSDMLRNTILQLQKPKAMGPPSIDTCRLLFQAKAANNLQACKELKQIVKDTLKRRKETAEDGMKAFTLEVLLRLKNVLKILGHNVEIDETFKELQEQLQAGEGEQEAQLPGVVATNKNEASPSNM